MPRTARKQPPQLTAQSADKYQLYQWSVQSPEHDLDLLVGIYKRRWRRPPLHFREDFSGTALMTACWLKRAPHATAEAFDLDSEPLDWGKRHNFAALQAPGAAQRAILHRADVRAPSKQPPDLRCAQNFSWFVFKKRRDLLEYFASAHEDLAPGGLFVLDIYGGPESMEEGTEETEIEQGFTYMWQQAKYWPTTGDYGAHIHFRFADGTTLKRAFSYEWRLWTLPETMDVLREAGFERIDTYWESVGADGVHGNGVYRRHIRGKNWASWIAYVICQK